MSSDLKIGGLANETEEVHFGPWSDEVPETGALRDRMQRTPLGKYYAPLYVLGVIFGFLVLSRFTHNFGSIIGLTGVIAMSVQTIRRRKAPSYVGRLVDIPPVLPTFPVMVRVRHANHVCSQDDGVISINGGYLHFEGMHSTFGLRSQEIDMHVKYAQKPTKKKWQQKSRNRQAFQTATAILTSRLPSLNGLTIEIHPYDQLEGLGRDLAEPFYDWIRSWKKDLCQDVPYSVYPKIGISKQTGINFKYELLLYVALVLTTLAAIVYILSYKIAVLNHVNYLNTTFFLGAIGFASAFVFVMRNLDFRSHTRKVEALARRLSPASIPQPLTEEISVTAKAR